MRARLKVSMLINSDFKGMLRLLADNNGPADEQ